MARGFGSLGAGATDVIVPAGTTEAVGQSWALWTYRVGEGGGNIGRMFDKAATPVLLNRLTNTSYEFTATWTSGVVTWTFPRPTANAWHHICVTYDTSVVANTPLVYVDGLPVTATLASAAPAGSYVPSANPYNIGNRPAADRNWDGGLAEFSVYNRILTPGEALAQGRDRFSAGWMRVGLVNHVELLRVNRDNRQTTAPTITGTAVLPHPPIIPYRWGRETTWKPASALLGNWLYYAHMGA